MKKQEGNILIPSVMTILIIAMVVCGYYIWQSYKTKEIVIDENTEGSAPSEEEQQEIATYEESCPVQTLIFEAETEVFNVTHVECSEDPRYTDVQEGEDVTVEIYTTDFEAGKQLFRNWLAENGLEENEKLRVEYVER